LGVSFPSTGAVTDRFQRQITESLQQQQQCVQCLLSTDADRPDTGNNRIDSCCIIVLFSGHRTTSSQALSSPVNHRSVQWV